MNGVVLPGKDSSSSSREPRRRRFCAHYRRQDLALEQALALDHQLFKLTFNERSDFTITVRRDRATTPELLDTAEEIVRIELVNPMNLRNLETNLPALCGQLRIDDSPREQSCKWTVSRVLDNPSSAARPDQPAQLQWQNSQPARMPGDHANATVGLPLAVAPDVMVKAPDMGNAKRSPQLQSLLAVQARGNEELVLSSAMQRGSSYSTELQHAVARSLENLEVASHERKVAQRCMVEQELYELVRNHGNLHFSNEIQRNLAGRFDVGKTEISRAIANVRAAIDAQFEASIERTVKAAAQARFATHAQLALRADAVAYLLEEDGEDDNAEDAEWKNACLLHVMNVFDPQQQVVSLGYQSERLSNEPEQLDNESERLVDESERLDGESGRDVQAVLAEFLPPPKPYEDLSTWDDGLPPSDTSSSHSWAMSEQHVDSSSRRSSPTSDGHDEPAAHLTAHAEHEGARAGTEQTGLSGDLSGSMRVVSPTGGIRDADSVGGGMSTAGCEVEADETVDSLAANEGMAEPNGKRNADSADADDEQEPEPEFDGDEEATFQTLPALEAALQAFRDAKGNAALLLEPTRVVVNALRNVTLVHAEARSCAQWIKAAEAVSDRAKKSRGGVSEPAPPATARAPTQSSLVPPPDEPAMQHEQPQAARATRSTAAQAREAAPSAESHEHFELFVHDLRQRAAAADARLADFEPQRNLLVSAFKRSRLIGTARSPEARHRRAKNFFGGCVSVDEHLNVIMPRDHVLLPHVDTDLHQLLNAYESADPELDAPKLVAHVRCLHAPVPRDCCSTHACSRRERADRKCTGADVCCERGGGAAQVRCLVMEQPHVAQCLEHAPFTEGDVLQAELTCELVLRLKQQVIRLNDSKCDATQGVQGLHRGQQQAHSEALELSAVTGAIQSLVKFRDAHAEFISARLAEHVYLLSLLAHSTGQTDDAAAATINVWPSDDATPQARRQRSLALWREAHSTLPSEALQLSPLLAIDEFVPALHGSKLGSVRNWEAMKCFKAVLADVPGVTGAISDKRIQLHQKPEMRKLLAEMYSNEKTRWNPNTTRSFEGGMDFAPRHKLVGLVSVDVSLVLYTLEAFLRRELIARAQSSAELLEPVTQLMHSLLDDFQKNVEQPKTPYEKWNVFTSSELLHELGRALGEEGFDSLPKTLLPNKHTVGGITRATAKLIHAARCDDNDARDYTLLLEREAILPAVVLSKCEVDQTAAVFKQWQHDTAPFALLAAPYTLQFDPNLSTFAPFDRVTVFERELELQRFRDGSPLTINPTSFDAYAARRSQYVKLQCELQTKLNESRKASAPAAGSARKATASPSNSDAEFPEFTRADAKLLEKVTVALQSTMSTAPMTRDLVLRSVQDDKDKLVKTHSDSHYDGFAHASMNANVVVAVPSGATPRVRRLDAVDNGISFVGGRAGTSESTLTLAESRTEMCLQQGGLVQHDVKHATVSESAAQSLNATDTVQRHATNRRQTSYCEQLHGNHRRTVALQQRFLQYADELAIVLATAGGEGGEGGGGGNGGGGDSLKARVLQLLTPTLWTSARDHAQTAMGGMPMDTSSYMGKRLPSTSNKTGRRGPVRDQRAAEFASKYFNAFGALLQTLNTQQRAFYDTQYLASATERVRQRGGEGDFLPEPTRAPAATKSKSAGKRQKTKTASSAPDVWSLLGALDATILAPEREAARSARQLKICEDTGTMLVKGDCFQFCTHNKNGDDVLWQGLITNRTDTIEQVDDPTPTVRYEAHILFETTQKPGRCPLRRRLSRREHHAHLTEWNLCKELKESDNTRVRKAMSHDLVKLIKSAYDERVEETLAADTRARSAPRQRGEATIATVAPGAAALCPPEWLCDELSVPFHAANNEKYSRADAADALKRCYVPSLGQGSCTDFPSTCYHSSVKGVALAAFSPTSDQQRDDATSCSTAKAAAAAEADTKRRSARKKPEMWKLVLFEEELGGERRYRDKHLRDFDSKQANALARSGVGTRSRYQQLQWRTRTAIYVPERLDSAVPPTECVQYNARIMQLYRYAAGKQVADAPTLDPTLDPAQFDPDELNVCWTAPNDDTKWAAQALHSLLQQPSWESHGVSWLRSTQMGTQLTARARNSAVTERATGFRDYDQVHNKSTVQQFNQKQQHNTLRGSRALANQLSRVAQSLSDGDRLRARQYGVHEGSGGEEEPCVKGAAFALAFHTLRQHAKRKTRQLVDFHFVNTANEAASFSWHVDVHAEDEGLRIDRSRLFQLSPGKTAMLIARSALPSTSPALDDADQKAIDLMAELY